MSTSGPITSFENNRIEASIEVVTDTSSDSKGGAVRLRQLGR